MSEPTLAEKVAFLSTPEAYATRPARVELKETHMSCVFLTDRHVWKLKKPSHYDYLDFSTLESRKRNCEREVELNRRLAANVYLGVVPLAIDAQGKMRLGGGGQVIDWLVMMHRLPKQQMLDAAIAANTAGHEDVRRLGMLLTRFYKQAKTIPLSAAEYASRLEVETNGWHKELLRAEYGLPEEVIGSIQADQMSLMKREAAMFVERARQGKIVDAHGDLRPEHICLGPEPVIIDCLEFNPDFRMLDPVSELAFLGLECDRLGAPWVGELILDVYRCQTGDHPPELLRLYYKRHHACVRAKIAVWHLKDPNVRDPAKWIDKAKGYLQQARSLEEFHN